MVQWLRRGVVDDDDDGERFSRPLRWRDSLLWWWWKKKRATDDVVKKIGSRCRDKVKLIVCRRLRSVAAFKRSASARSMCRKTPKSIRWDRFKGDAITVFDKVPSKPIAPRRCFRQSINSKRSCCGWNWKEWKRSNSHFYEVLIYNVKTKLFSLKSFSGNLRLESFRVARCTSKAGGRWFAAYCCEHKKTLFRSLYAGTKWSTKCAHSQLLNDSFTMCWFSPKKISLNNRFRLVSFVFSAAHYLRLENFLNYNFLLILIMKVFFALRFLVLAERKKV